MRRRSTGAAWLHISLHPPGPTQVQHRHTNPDPQTRGSCVPSLSILGIFEPLGWGQAQLGSGSYTISLADSGGPPSRCIRQHFCVCPVYLSAWPVDPAGPLNSHVAPEGTPHLGPVTGFVLGNHRQCLRDSEPQLCREQRNQTSVQHEYVQGHRHSWELAFSVCLAEDSIWGQQVASDLPDLSQYTREGTHVSQIL